MTVKEDGRYAVTHYRVKEQINNRYTLVECQLETDEPIRFGSILRR